MQGRARRAAKGLPEPAKELLRRVVGPAASSHRLRRLARPVRWGSLRSHSPVSDRWGFDRGTPVDRYYLDRFFAAAAPLIRGRVLEVRDPEYTDRFGHDLRSVDLVDIDPDNDLATIVADLSEPQSLPAGRFDCAVVPQTLQFVDDPEAAVANLWQSLAPGGALVVTVPSLSRVDPYGGEADRWRWLPSGLGQLVVQACDGHGRLDVSGFGNLVSATAFLHGMAAEELAPDDLDPHNQLFTMLACATVTKPRA